MLPEDKAEGATCLHLVSRGRCCTVGALVKGLRPYSAPRIVCVDRSAVSQVEDASAALPTAHTCLSLMHTLLHYAWAWDDRGATLAEEQPTLSMLDWLLATTILLVNLNEGAVLRGDAPPMGAASTALLKVRTEPPCNLPTGVARMKPLAASGINDRRWRCVGINKRQPRSSGQLLHHPTQTHQASTDGGESVWITLRDLAGGSVARAAERAHGPRHGQHSVFGRVPGAPPCR